MYLDKFSTRLKALMEMENISKRALALKLGVDRTSIRLWLSGRFFPRYDALIKLAIFFKVRIDSLVGLEDTAEDGVELLVEDNEFDDDPQKCFFEQVSRYMTEQGWSKYAFAKKLNIDQKAFKNWLLNGSMPETATIIRLSLLINVSIDELLGRKV